MSLMHALSVSASGMDAQSTRMRLLAENLANAQTTRTPEGGPYRRKDAVLESAEGVKGSFAGHLATAMAEPLVGVRVSELIENQEAVDLRYEPGHPDADADGYVAYPHVNPAEELINLQGAARAYEANIAAMSTAKEMLRRSMELLR
ncbi:MAG: flagellar basal body rod protein FlgC [Bryobacterales bacterium]|jgi:flagellar basal-body rod protein FlgC|nr:flagellar basal body rod protein FlgC [Bryobacterales bacterium]